MHDYQIIIKILSAVLEGRNLNEVFAQNIADTSQETNIGKIKDICYGVLRHYFSLSMILNKLIAKKPNDKVVYILLLIAIYEIKYTKKPPFAVTNDMVNLSEKLSKNSKIKSFVNAVIRNYIRNGADIEQELLDRSEFKYDFPPWWINKLKQNYTNYHDVLLNSNCIPKMALRVNPRKISVLNYIEELRSNNIEFLFLDDIDHDLEAHGGAGETIHNKYPKVVLLHSISVDRIPFFSEGCVSIQDIHAQKLIDLISFNPGEQVLDACSAPGGKLCQILENNDVDATALDIDNSRLAKVEQNLTRIGLKAKLIQADATELNWWDRKLFDTVIADVPCSASGTVKRNPDIKLHRRPSDIDNFVTIQRKIIANLWQVLKPGGQMLYITCSIFPEENEDNIEFLKANLSGIQVIKSLKLTPTECADGFYYCVLKKS